MTGSRKLALTGALFGLLVALLAVSIATKSVVPLFFAWLPPLAVAWILVRPGPGEDVPPAGDPFEPAADAP